ncbi:hypothetical protein DFJ58DRAFT_771387 [Suillus subalutaceus]|uniref:uncharacterized protein n=1 Tax=Suillus subalutaceus TaxID=48586 RepID=UPI001B883466|nr:uncharacterized protein DFJ58DRAFT_771387 [Suillus subalutaceus]KAG1865511.1 hypothetical protein DFJ58DRAFT_771387 [Suillus subalutaceus]
MLTNIVNVTQHNIITMPAQNMLFAMAYAAQRSNTELISHSRDAGQCVQIAYPVSTGFRILPGRIAAYLRRRRCFWECFCGFAHEHPTPVQFVTSATGHIQVVCHFRDNRCKFSSMFSIFVASYYLHHYFQSTLTRYDIRRCSNHRMMTSQHEF